MAIPELFRFGRTHAHEFLERGFPRKDSIPAVFAEGLHSLVDSDASNFAGGTAIHTKLPQLRAVDQQLKNRDSSGIARIVTFAAALISTVVHREEASDQPAVRRGLEPRLSCSEDTVFSAAAE